MYSKYLEKYGVVYSAFHLDLALSVKLVWECLEVLGTAEFV